MAIGVGVGLAAAWSVKRLRDADLLAPALDGYHAIATVLVIYGLAEVAGAYGFLAAFAGGIAFRRYEHDHEVNARVHEGAELSEKLLELAVVLLLGSMLTLGGPRRAGLGGLAARGARAGRRSARWRASRRSRAASSTHPSEKTFVAWFGVRGVGSLFYLAVAVEAGVLGAGERDLVVWTVIAVRAALDRRPRHHGRAVDAARCSRRARQADAARSRREDARSSIRSSTAASSSGWWIGSSPGSSVLRDPLERRADRAARRRRRRTRAGRCRRRGRPPACCRGSRRPP